MSIEIFDDFLAFFNFSSRNFVMSLFELVFLFLVVARYIVEFLSHVVSAHIPVRVLGELIRVKLVVHFIFDGFKLELFQCNQQLLLKELLHCSVLLLDVKVFGCLNRLLQLLRQLTVS